MTTELDFNPNKLLVTINSSGIIEFDDLYRQIREWEASLQGISFDIILEGVPSVELPDGTKTPKVMIFVNGWKLSTINYVSIVGGYVAGRDKYGNSIDPFDEESKDKISVSSIDEDLINYEPSNEQIEHVMKEADKYEKDWEIINDELLIKRKSDPTFDKYSIVGLYWFLKTQYLKNQELRKLHFPIRGDNLIPRKGRERNFELLAGWRINTEDLKCLEGGILSSNGKQLAPTKQE